MPRLQQKMQQQLFFKCSTNATLILMPRICLPTQMNVERRLFSFRFGDPRAQMNWVHVDNLVLAHKLAAEALTPERSCIAVSPRQNERSTPILSFQQANMLSCSTPASQLLWSFLTCSWTVVWQSGQAYFINDGVSVNLFEWLTPLVSRCRFLSAYAHTDMSSSFVTLSSIVVQTHTHHS